MKTQTLSLSLLLVLTDCAGAALPAPSTALLPPSVATGTPVPTAALPATAAAPDLSGDLTPVPSAGNFQSAGAQTADQKAARVAMRTGLLGDLSHPAGACLYSRPVAMPTIPRSDFPFH